MSAACEALVALAGGRGGPGEALLHNVRFEGWGTEAAGEEAVLELTQLAPFQSDRWERIADVHGAAVIADDVVWIADTANDRLARVWRLGPGQPVPAEPMLAVPFDTELQQARRSRLEVGLQGLPTNIVADLATAVAEAAGGIRRRAFPLRAIIDDRNVFLLFAVYRLAGRPVRTSGFTYTAARMPLNGSIDAAVILRDAAGEAAADQRITIARL